jgi:hypothetical protein
MMTRPEYLAIKAEVNLENTMRKAPHTRLLTKQANKQRTAELEKTILHCGCSVLGGTYPGICHRIPQRNSLEYDKGLAKRSTEEHRPQSTLSRLRNKVFGSGLVFEVGSLLDLN